MIKFLPKIYGVLFTYKGHLCKDSFVKFTYDKNHNINSITILHGICNIRLKYDHTNVLIEFVNFLNIPDEKYYMFNDIIPDAEIIISIDIFYEHKNYLMCVEMNIINISKKIYTEIYDILLTYKGNLFENNLTN